MAAVTFGNLLADLKPQPDSGLVSTQADGIVTVTRIWKARYAICRAAQENYSVAYPKSPDPGDNLDGVGALNAWCISANVEKSPPDWGLLTAQYQGYVFLPIDIFERTTNRLERPINYHPDFNDPLIFGYRVGIDAPSDPQTKVCEQATLQGVNITDAYNFVKFLDSSAAAPLSNKFAGIETYPVASVIWRRTSFSQNPVPVSNRLFKLDAPVTTIFNWNAIPDPLNQNDHWIKTADDTNNLLRGASILWTRTEEWTYNVNGWLSEIYD